MNRYSMIFAILIASSFAVRSPQSREVAGTQASSLTGKHHQSSATKNPPSSHPPAAEEEDTPASFVGDFLNNEVRPGGRQPQILFAAVPHPLETHLAASFDHNLEALQSGLAAANFVFDSAWIPWTKRQEREGFEDDEKEKHAEEQEDKYPGILLFRDAASADTYRAGLIVFLITEKPTEGLALAQVKSAWDILVANDVGLSDKVRILGPNYSGSFASLTAILSFLHQRIPSADFLVRSGGVSVSAAAVEAGQRMSGLLGKSKVDFGSALHNYDRWIDATGEGLSQMGIGPEEVVILSENESTYGGYPILNPRSTGPWKLAFPRDISSLRAGYENQGILQSLAPMQPWQRVLNLASDDQADGDTIKTFGGSSTLAIQEGMLLGISAFMRTHSIRAVVIAATNPEDSYFLAQFLHAHNSSIRIAVLGSSRIFLRNSTAEFRGDMIVDDFPMLPRLPDWTGARAGSVVQIFGDDVAEGVYFASLDLFKERFLGPNALPDRLPEYSGPAWGASIRTPYPAMFVAAIGNSANWPLYEQAEPQDQLKSGSWQVSMPFALEGSKITNASTGQSQFQPGGLWYWSFTGLTLLTCLYCACFWIANPISRVICASFQPAPFWRYWMLCVIIPGGICACAFDVLAWSARIPGQIPNQFAAAWTCAEASSAFAPLLITGAAISKSLTIFKLKWNLWMTASFFPFVCTFVIASVQGLFSGGRSNNMDFNTVATAYREMHFESGLSLVPTLMLLLLGFFVWTRQATSAEALLNAAPPLPRIPGSARVSRTRGGRIIHLSKPIPPLGEALGMWIGWMVAVAIALMLHLSKSLQLVTSLESYTTTCVVRWVAFAIVCLILLDVAQFLNVWNELRGLLRALKRERFKRGFVPIDDFTWPTLWSFNGASFRDRRAIDAALSDCIRNLSDAINNSEIRSAAKEIEEILSRYNRVFPKKVSPATFAQDRFSFFLHVSRCANEAAILLDRQEEPAAENNPSSDTAALCRAVASLKTDAGPFRDEADLTKKLPPWQQKAERLICLMYVAFIQAIVARLHTLLVSIATMFSLLVLGFAIYPFVPFLPLLLSGATLLVIIGWSFFKVFSELDTDPILSRIVNGDDRKLQSNFYLKISEALALPLLTLGSTILPGGAGRILEMAQTLLNHGQ